MLRTIPEKGKRQNLKTSGFMIQLKVLNKVIKLSKMMSEVRCCKIGP